MKKIISMCSVIMISALSFAFITPAQAATDWDVSGDYVVTFVLGGDYPHDMFLTQDAFGDVTGNGGYLAGNLPYSYTWNITSGTVSDDTINLTIDYTLGAPGTTMHMTGTIDPDGTMSGEWDDNFGGYREGTWSTTDGAAVDTDNDNDGVINGDDFCPNTIADEDWDVSWGNNRWEVQDVSGNLVWYQNKVGKKGVTTPTAGESIDYTYGCNGHQIIGALNSVFGSVMNGHLKYGLSSGVIEEFHNDLNDGVLDGQYYLETITVPAVSTVPVLGTINLLSGHDYAFKASGTANAGAGIQFDAEYSNMNATTWLDGVASPYDGDVNLLDLQLNGGFVNWDNDAVYNPSHIYWYETAGTNAPASAQVYDTYYPGNTGSLTVDIYAII